MSSLLAKSWMLLGLGIAGLIIIGRRQRAALEKGHGAFIQYFELLPPPPPPPPKAPPPLTGLTFAVKDIFDIEGMVTGFGNPDWLKTHEPAIRTAPAVELVLQAGAKCIGKTHMDEFAYSINGENKHYGTPVNPAAPSRIPGGSSSGSAVAVAADLVDFALGTDTGGSVRAPAAFCGILGFRPSHGVIPTEGVTPMAQSFDTVGWFAKDPAVLRQVGHVLLQLPYMEVRQPRRVLIADDCFKMSLLPQDQILGSVLKAIHKLLGRQVVQMINVGDYIERNVLSIKSFRGAENLTGSTLEGLRDAMRALQRCEFKDNHGEWINSVQPDIGSDTAGRIKDALEASSDLVSLIHKIREQSRLAMNELLKNDTILVLPTVPDLAPRLNSKESTLAEFRSKAFTLLCIGGMSGCPQVNLPVGEVDDVPVGVSIMAKHGGDRFLLDTVVALYASVQEEAKIVFSNKNTLSVGSGKNEAAEAAKERGNAAFKEQDYPKAVTHYTEAIRLDGQSATYYSNRAAAYLQMCNFPQAEADCTKAISLDKKNVKALLRRGTAREFLGYYKDADEDFRQALVLEPTNKQAIEAVKRLKKLLYE
ncbi:protein MpAMI1 [Marchantia polymorpha subsp. ruderalis]|uniref:Amidase domain-containing protein n=2 Tax=Marchantia polymorpha TaxID=3197 RepID=A0AAF6BJI8_MARPO|nr:hypothetical protein MARPO_0084s0045 [Marchantia polymorpha]BBN12172.1 hypothetical protein Mp_5g17980 [Marchantia polymorpha subsp. ruderalis]|eukprot:PTQ33959.1 hypothetical protein MARPO_0084s0045 [Marchantia polymorpha]